MGWHARASELTGWEGEGLEAALLLLGHAASGLLHRPAFASVAGSAALVEVDQAASRLEACGCGCTRRSRWVGSGSQPSTSQDCKRDGRQPREPASAG